MANKVRKSCIPWQLYRSLESGAALDFQEAFQGQKLFQLFIDRYDFPSCTTARVVSRALSPLFSICTERATLPCRFEVDRVGISNLTMLALGCQGRLTGLLPCTFIHQA